jgi:hypothetical protein
LTVAENGMPADMLALAYRGFQDAERRYELASLQTNPLGPFIPLTEALWWAVAADEGLRDLVPTYQAQRDADPIGSLLHGIRYARNRLGHQRALAVRASFYRTYEKTDDGRWVEKYEQNEEGRWVRRYKHHFVWRPLDHLPTPGQSDPKGEKGYRLRLEGNSADRTLGACSDWLKRSLARTGPV